MGSLFKHYTETCEASKDEPDMQLLSPIKTRFEELQEKGT